MDNPINGLVADLVAETARETNEIAGLESLLVFLEKFDGRPGLVTQKDRSAAAKKIILEKIAGIRSGSRA